MAIAPTATLAELVIADSRRSRIFKDLGLDYCCNGDNSLQTAVEAAGLNLFEVQAALDLPAEPEAVESAPRERAALAHDIVDTHHAYMWEEMPRLKELVDLVYRVRGDAHPELAEVTATYDAAITELDPHMTSEERVVFRAISKMERDLHEHIHKENNILFPQVL